MSTPAGDAVRKHKEYLFPAVSMYYKEPIALVKGEGPYVWDEKGNRYLDAFGGVLTVSVGHANPKITNAVRNRPAHVQIASWTRCFASSSSVAAIRSPF